MTRTPDEIKKGLECCADGNIVCAGNCIFDDDDKLVFPDCKRMLMTNALALIQQLEAERDALMHWAKGRCDTCAHMDDCVRHDPDPEGYIMHWYDDCETWEWRGAQKEE